jgi:hypothetical protein
MDSLTSQLAQFTGTEQYHYNPLYPWLKYTDGVRFFAGNAGSGAYWFLDIIGTELRKHTVDEPFLSIGFSVYTDKHGVINVTDGNDKQVYVRKLEYTDCPAGDYKFFLLDNVLMLSSEY